MSNTTALMTALAEGGIGPIVVEDREVVHRSIGVTVSGGAFASAAPRCYPRSTTSGFSDAESEARLTADGDRFTQMDRVVGDRRALELRCPGVTLPGRVSRPVHPAAGEGALSMSPG